MTGRRRCRVRGNGGCSCPPARVNRERRRSARRRSASTMRATACSKRRRLAFAGRRRRRRRGTGNVCLSQTPRHRSQVAFPEADAAEVASQLQQLVSRWSSARAARCASLAQHQQRPAAGCRAANDLDPGRGGVARAAGVDAAVPSVPAGAAESPSCQSPRSAGPPPRTDRAALPPGVGPAQMPASPTASARRAAVSHRSVATSRASNVVAAGASGGPLVGDMDRSRGSGGGEGRSMTPAGRAAGPTIARWDGPNGCAARCMAR